jgi:hypothetical protein
MQDKLHKLKWVKGKHDITNCEKMPGAVVPLGGAVVPLDPQVRYYHG